jgi:flagellar assembly protein FliH
VAILKSGKAAIQDYAFNSLVPGQELESGTRDYEFGALESPEAFKTGLTDEDIRTERNLEAIHGFSIAKEVKQHRGLSKQADTDYELKISNEVERRVAAIKEAAYDEGYKAGEAEGHKQAYSESQVELEGKINEFVIMVENLNASVKEIYEQNKNEAYMMVKNLTKWVILKEVDEKYYLTRLLEKLVYEINTKSNLVVHVNESSFGYMPEVVKIVERKLGVLQNIRLEIDLDQEENASGIILESENSIVDGSLETQLASIDTIFENAGLHE